MRNAFVSKDLRDAVLKKIEETLVTCRLKYGPSYPLVMPPIHFRQMGRKAGYYQPQRFGIGYIAFNPDFFKNHYDDMLNNTVPHEVAHYVTHMVYGHSVKAHGYEWKSVMRVVGLPSADRCHTYDLEGVKVREVNKPYQYECGCMTHHFTNQKHQKALYYQSQFNRTGFKCRNCRKQLVYRGFTHNGIFVPHVSRPVVPVVEQPKKMETVNILLKNVVVTSQPTYRVVTAFVNGILTNVKVPTSQPA